MTRLREPSVDPHYIGGVDNTWLVDNYDRQGWQEPAF
jgi:hypothetical protein